MVEIPNKKMVKSWDVYHQLVQDFAGPSMAIRVLLGTPGDGSQPGRTQEPPGHPGKRKDNDGKLLMEDMERERWNMKMMDTSCSM
jgi:hypothetical protein